jgi:hypothetical protein
MPILLLVGLMLVVITILVSLLYFLEWVLENSKDLEVAAKKAVGQNKLVILATLFLLGLILVLFS